LTDSSSLRRSALLGQRKSRSTPDKPMTFSTRKARAEEPSNEPEPAHAGDPVTLQVEAPQALESAKPLRSRDSRRRSSKTAKQPSVSAVPVPTPLEAEVAQLVLRVARLADDLAARPSWEDLRGLEARLKPEADAWESEREQLRAELRLRQEELDEMATLLQDFEEQQQQAQERIKELERNSDEDRLARRQLEKLLNSARGKLRQEELQRLESSTRLNQAEAFLREALLGLLSPNDEFNEELVEQIQMFLELNP
jgi:chromosome segregation ATPase